MTYEIHTVGVFMPEGTEAEVCADIARRQAFGQNKYGTTVAENQLSLRAWLHHEHAFIWTLPLGKMNF